MDIIYFLIMGKKLDLTEKKFGKLTAIEPSGKSDRNGVLWRCKCDCGNEKIVYAGNLNNGSTISCGCLYKESFLKVYGIKNKEHGERIVRIRDGMLQRCYDKNSPNYYKYGERGITVCKEWRVKKYGLINFYNWSINNGYRDDLSIDRIDNNGPYSPQNCRWTTVKQQANNKRNNRFLEYKGEKHTVSEWSKIIGITTSTIYRRLKNNFPISEVLQKNRVYKRSVK